MRSLHFPANIRMFISSKIQIGWKGRVICSSPLVPCRPHESYPPGFAYMICWSGTQMRHQLDALHSSPRYLSITKTRNSHGANVEPIGQFHMGPPFFSPFISQMNPTSKRWHGFNLSMNKKLLPKIMCDLLDPWSATVTSSSVQLVSTTHTANP